MVPIAVAIRWTLWSGDGPRLYVVPIAVACHAKNGPTQMWSRDQFWQPKAVPPDQFWQPKVVPPPDHFWQPKVVPLAKNGPPFKITEHALYHCKTTSGSQNGHP